MRQKGFTLVELMVVLVILGVLFTVVMMTISRNPQNKARDSIRRSDIDRIAEAYESDASETNRYQPLEQSALYNGKVPKPPEGGNYQGLVTTTADGYMICAQLEKGKDLNCLENSENLNCYCRKSKNYNGGGNGNPSPEASPTPSSSAVASSTPGPSLPPENPWGQAAQFAGKPAYLNPPSYVPLPEFLKADYSNKMDIPGQELTVEAWIKPVAPVQDGHHYRIADNTYRLTMHPRPNGSNVSYKYYFDVQTRPNGPCGQTVVQSDIRLKNDPWNINYYKTVTKAEFETWKHVVGVFKNSVFYIFEDGVLLNTYDTTATNETVCNDGRSMHVGVGLYGKSTPYYDNFQGLIDEVRVSDIARYTSNYTRPVAPFTQDANTDMLYHFDGNTSDFSTNDLDGSFTGQVEYVDSTIPTD